MVDDTDASILGANWMTPTGAGWSQGDFNGDGAVNDRDAAILAAHWGTTPGGEGSVPEPSSLTVLANGLLFLLLWRRRR